MGAKANRLAPGHRSRVDNSVSAASAPPTSRRVRLERYVQAAGSVLVTGSIVGGSVHDAFPREAVAPRNYCEFRCVPAVGELIILGTVPVYGTPAPSWTGSAETETRWKFSLVDHVVGGLIPVVEGLSNKLVCLVWQRRIDRWVVAFRRVPSFVVGGVLISAQLLLADLQHAGAEEIAEPGSNDR